jgi:aspartate beta-hydroxylase
MTNPVQQLEQQANAAAASGRWDEAERLWMEVEKLDPRHPKALFSLGVHAFQRGDVRLAAQKLRAARVAAPDDLLVLLTLSSACRELDDSAGEREAIDAALALDPYFVPALLAKANWLERFGTRAAAVATYRNVLKIAPPKAQWPAELRDQLEYAHQLVERHSKALHAHLTARLADQQAALPEPLAARWREAISIRAGRSRPYLSESNQLCVPRLPAIPFFERSYFPWAAELESKTDVIRAELLALLESERERFSPYINYKPGEPVNQWRELNHSHRWSAYHLWRNGVPVKENLERCPQTAAALSALPLADIDDLCPNAMFSALAPRTTIPPHNGETNARVIAHLPLIVPDNCLYRVGFDERRWKVGELLVFDDTIEHEARNDSDELRVVLIFDLWNPLLTPEERQLVRTMAIATREFG